MSRKDDKTVHHRDTPAENGTSNANSKLQTDQEGAAEHLMEASAARAANPAQIITSIRKQ
jgi:hypothetical protein